MEEQSKVEDVMDHQAKEDAPTISSDPSQTGEKNHGVGKTILKVLGGLLCLVLVGILSVAAVFYYFGKDLPDFEGLKDYDPPQVTRVFDRNGVQVAEFFTERRSVVGLEAIPPVMRQAMVSAEDGNFYEHHGLDYLGILRALIVDVREMRLAQGASTITQQVIKNMVLTSERKFSRKIKEAILARRIEQNLTKDEILALYLNHIYFGHGRYGIREASLFYFHKEPMDLTLAEAATLAALPQSPGRLSPLRNPAKSAQRRQYVLDQMARNGFITRPEAEAAMKAPIHAVGWEVAQVGPHYVEAIRRNLVSRYGRKSVYEGGLKVTLAMDAMQQAAAETALTRGLEELEKKRGLKAATTTLSQEVSDPLKDVFLHQLREAAIRAKARAQQALELEVFSPDDGEEDGSEDEVAPAKIGWDFGSLSALELANFGALSRHGIEPDQAVSTHPATLSLTKVASKLRRVPLVAGATLLAPLKSVSSESLDFDLGDAVGRVDASTLSWAGLKKDKPLAPFGLYRVRVLQDHPPRKKKKQKPLPQSELAKVPLEIVPVPSVQAAIVAIDPKTHQVTAIGGGYDFASSQFNRATQARRQPGSSFKPIVYGAALESGRYTLASIVNDAPDIFRDPWTKKAWRPQNFEKNVYEGPMSLREALSKSKNTVSVRLIEAVGPDAVIDFARRAGISSPLPANLTLGLGSGEVTPLELANAYATLASMGTSAEPEMLLEVLAKDGSVLEKAALSAEETISPTIAFLVTSLMQSVVEDGTGRRAKALKRPVAGKTGTASENRDAWFAGFTPDLVAVVWVGRDDHKPIGRSGTGGVVALPIWLSFMEKALDGVPPTPFEIPEGVEAVRIDPTTGRRILEEASTNEALASEGTATDETPTSQGNESSEENKPGRVEYFVVGTAPEEVAVPEGDADPRMMLMEDGL